MNLSRLLPALALAPLVACVEEATEGAQLLAPERVAVNWDEGFDAEEDGMGAMVPVDLMVYEGASGEPLESVELRFTRISDTLVLVDPEAVEVLPSDCTLCVWDATRDRYLDWSSADDFQAVQTDEDGLARVYVWVDRFPEAGAPALFFEIAMDDATAVVELVEE